MRWLALVLVVPLVACESRVIVSRPPSSQTTTPSASAAPSPSPTASPSPTKAALRSLPSFSPATRLVSYERVSDIPVAPTLRFLLTDDSRVVTEDSPGYLVERRLTPSGAAAMVLQAIETGLFEREAQYARELLPGRTLPARGVTWLVLIVANGPRDVRVSFEPTGQPDDELFQPSAARDKLTALARGYEDLSWVPASHWAEVGSRAYQPAFHRLFVLTQPNVVPASAAPDADAIWPFLATIDGVGAPMGGTSWRCAVLVDDDARALAQAAVFPGYGAGSARASTSLARGNGSVELQISPLLPHEPATCAGAPPPL
ncbi:MAG TPA: hypothetical protein VMQ78_01635 [Candidatus Limnocylindria bacterium]|nr:hypothetical protein [Candidatus Limnocylindria bacterium]